VFAEHLLLLCAAGQLLVNARNTAARASVLQVTHQLALSPEGLLELHDVALTQHPEHLDLTQRGPAHDLVLCRRTQMQHKSTPCQPCMLPSWAQVITAAAGQAPEHHQESWESPWDTRQQRVKRVKCS
jgi:hypothetical protein